MVASSPENQLKVLSFNVWGLAIVAKQRAPRIRAIAEYIAASSYDIVCLQECWIYKDYEYIRDEVLQILPFSRFFHTGALGSGLAIFTRFPIVSARAMPYSLSGTPQQAFAGDFFVNKAAGYVVIRHPVLGEVEIWSTHMHAAGEHPPDTRQAHRIAQSWQLSNAMRSGAAKGRYIMAMGDFNSQPSSVPIQLMRTHGQCTDAFLETHPTADVFSPSPASPLEAIHQLGMTCDSPLNSWSGAKNIPPHIKAQGGKRLDYIFYRQPAPPLRRPVARGQGDEQERVGEDGKVQIGHMEDHVPVLKCVKTEVVLTENVPGQAYSYSDHFGLVATFSIDPPAKDSLGGSNPFETPNRLSRASEHSQPSYAPPTSRQAANANTMSSASSKAIIRQAQKVLASYKPISARSKRVHLRVSSASVLLLLALAIGSAWQPKSYLQPIFTLLGALAGAAAATFFYLGFVWGRWEEGLLTEVIDEMEIEVR